MCKALESKKTAYQRIELKEKCEKELQNWLDVAKPYKELKTVRTKIENGFENGFTCIKFAGVQPTNNYAEQAIRETVLVRKIIGAFRSMKGTKTYETLASLIATWQLQKSDIKKELTRMLSTNLC